MAEEKKFLLDMFGVNLQRAEEIIKDIHVALYMDPTVVNEVLFIDYLRNKYKDGEREFALYIGARVSERAATPRSIFGKLSKAFKV